MKCTPARNLAVELPVVGSRWREQIETGMSMRRGVDRTVSLGSATQVRDKLHNFRLSKRELDVVHLHGPFWATFFILVILRTSTMS